MEQYIKISVKWKKFYYDNGIEKYEKEKSMSDRFSVKDCTENDFKGSPEQEIYYKGEVGLGRKFICLGEDTLN